MSKTDWRFLPIMTQSAPVGVALDEVLLDSKHKGISPNTVRFYHFSPPAVICGYHQAIEDEVDIVKVREYGFDLTRRITGGGTLFVAPDQLGIATILDRGIVPRSPVKAIRWFSEAIVSGLNQLGINARFRPKNDIVVNKRKLVGTGQAVRGRAVLFHAIILIELDVQIMLEVLKIPQIKYDEKEKGNESALGWCFHPKLDIAERFTTINTELDEKIDHRLIQKALRKGFEEKFGVSLNSNGLLPQEQKLHQKYIDRYKSDKWIFLRRLGGAQIKAYTEKTKGGLVRIKVALNDNLIKSIVISGDFFVFPPGAILDLEACLKWSPVEPQTIRKTVHTFFKKNKVKILWLSSDEFADILVNAIKSE